MRKIQIVLFLLVMICVSCKNGNPHTSTGIVDKQTNNGKPYHWDSTINEHIKANGLIKKRLMFQLQEGCSEEYGSFDNYTMEDLEASAFIINEMLATNGFKTLSNESFDKNVNDIFHRTIDRNSDNMFLKVDKDNICDKTMKLHPFGEHQYYYISKQYNMVFIFYQIPYLINYDSIYPDVKVFEKNLSKEIETTDGMEKDDSVTISYWKDVVDIKSLRTYYKNEIININKYLFNNDTASLEWLINNDSIFIDRLVRIFGYDKEPRINKAVLASAQKQYYGTHYINVPDNNWVFENLIAAKDCNGQLQIREGLLKTIADETNSDANKLFDMLKNYCDFLAHPAKDSDTLFNFQERCKIIAYITNTVYPLFTKYKDSWHTVLSSDIVTEIAKNNYYGLPQLKTFIDAATQ